jgi:hypothetical protein
MQAGLAGGNQGVAGLADPSGLNRNETPPVTGALGVIGPAAGPANKETVPMSNGHSGETEESTQKERI